MLRARWYWHTSKSLFMVSLTLPFANPDDSASSLNPSRYSMARMAASRRGSVEVAVRYCTSGTCMPSRPIRWYRISSLSMCSKSALSCNSGLTSSRARCSHAVVSIDTHRARNRSGIQPMLDAHFKTCLRANVQMALRKNSPTPPGLPQPFVPRQPLVIMPFRYGTVRQTRSEQVDSVIMMVLSILSSGSGHGGRGMKPATLAKLEHELKKRRT